MKTTNEKQFDAVAYMRQQREKLSSKLAKMNKAEIVDYFRQKQKKSTVKPSA